MNPTRFAVILAGGKGSRFWPLSTPQKPKQFLPFSKDGKSLIRSTLDRIQKLIAEEQIVIVATRALQNVLEQETGESKATLLFEPEGKNTAPSIAYATAFILEKNPEAVIGVFPADHLIEDENAWQHTVDAAFKSSSEDSIVTVGIKPTSAHTGFGYIEIKNKDAACKTQIHDVLRFTEKPNIETAKMFFESGKHFFNSGMFFFRASKMWQSLEQYLPEIFEIFEEWQSLSPQKRYPYLEKKFESLPSISVDYGIMEREEHLKVIPGEWGWSDLGTWDAIWKMSSKTSDQNHVQGNVEMMESQQCLVHSTTAKPVVVIGAKNLVIVDTEQGLLVVSKDQTQKVKDAVEKLADKTRSDS